MTQRGINGLIPGSSGVHATRLRERDVRHLRISDSTELKSCYNFGETIGQGGFGTVMSATEKRTEKKWAIKILCKHSLAGVKMKLVQREINILKMVNHPHIIYLDKVYESAKKIYLILELCYGELAEIYRIRKQFSEKDTRKIIKDLVSAIVYLHKNDIVHRDLKLENILMADNPLDPSDTLYTKISDFGLSIIKSGSGYENMLHDCCGTLTYMSPEIITNQSYSQQTDVWALGVIMYMLLGGHYPFFSVDERELRSMICTLEPSFSGFTASPEAIHLVTKMLAKNPAVRITAAEIAHHAWIVGKPMEHDSPENVLDMMRLWRSEMMLPVGEESDWASVSVANSTHHITNSASWTLPLFPIHNPTHARETCFAQSRPDTSSTESSEGSAPYSRKPSVTPTVKNLQFQRSRKEFGGTKGLHIGYKTPKSTPQSKRQSIQSTSKYDRTKQKR